MAEKAFLTHLNLSQNELRNALIHKVDAMPSAPKTGQIVYWNGSSETYTQHKLYVYNGSAWKIVGSDYVAGDGLSLTGNSFSVDNTVVRTSGEQTIAGSKLFSSPVRLQDGGTYEAQYDAGHIKYIYGTNTYTYSFPQKTGTLALKSDIEIISAGTGLSKSGTTLNHTDSITATTAVAFKKFKYNGTGHITGVADVTASDIPELGAGKITSGTFSADRIPTLAQSKITNLTADLAAKEVTDNKVTSLNSTSTDNQYPSAKTVYEFVNSSISSSASYFRGNFATDTDLKAVAWQTTNPSAPYYVTNNDYAVVSSDSTHSGEMWRWKYTAGTGTGSGWNAEYKINDAPFTQAQWNAVNSGITSTKVSTYDTHVVATNNPHNVTKDQVDLGNVVNTGDSATPVQNGTTKFTTGGAYTLKTSLEAAIAGRQPAFTDGSATIASKSGDVVTIKTGVSQSGGKIANASGTDITLAAVASTGSYSDLSNKPTIPTVNNATLTLQANGTTKTTFYANDGTNRTFNIANGTSTTGNGTISVGGAAVSVYGLGTAAYANVGAFVQTSGDQTVAGSKTFSDGIIVTHGAEMGSAIESALHADGISVKADSTHSYNLVFPTKTGTFALLSDIPPTVDSSYSELSLTFTGGSTTGEWSEVIKTTAPIQVVKTSTHEQIDCKVVYSYTSGKLSGATITINGSTGSTAPTGYSALCIAGSSLA